MTPSLLARNGFGEKSGTGLAHRRVERLLLIRLPVLASNLTLAPLGDHSADADPNALGTTRENSITHGLIQCIQILVWDTHCNLL